MSSVPKAVYEVSNDVRQYLPKFRQQYRALLREATYLPDPAARNFVHDLIVKRYNPPNPKKLNPKYWGTDYFRSKIDLNKLLKRSKKTSQKLHLLERINREGSSKDLQNVLLRTYGRAGQRRRELLSQLLRPGEDELPQDDTALSHMIDSQIAKNLDATKDVEIDRANEVTKSQRREHKELTLFLASQQANNPMESIRGKIKKLKPEIPARNAWGRPLPVARKENMKRKWWANLLERVLPPLPEHEWNSLRDLAQGKQPIEDPRPRRKEATSHTPNTLTSDSERIRFLMVPARVNLNHWEQGTWKDDLENSSTKHSRTRAMRRMYGMIWSLSSKMVRDEDTERYTITWGGERSLAASGNITKPSLKDAELFEIPEEGLAEGTADKKFRKLVGRKVKQIER